MSSDRTTLRPAPAIQRRPAVSPRVQRSPAETPRSPAQTLQHRIGNRATQILISRSIASRSAETNDRIASVSITTTPGIQRSEHSSKHTRLPAAVSKPRDPAELEAEETARKVMRMQQPPAVTPTAPAQKGIAKGTTQRAEASPSPRAPLPASSPRVNIPGGSPLPSAVRSHMEPRFGANFGNVRIHAGEAAAQQSASLNAHAFTVGEHIFFGRDQYQPQSASGRELIAHELTHTIQQEAVVQRQVDPTVTQRSEPQVHRLGVSDALNWIADKANYLPGFRLLTIVLGMNPINFAPVERSAANILRALLELIPVTGALLAQALDGYGIFAKVGAWVDGQIRTLGLVGGSLKSALDKFLDSLSWTDIFRLDDVYERGKRIFTEPISRLIEFGKSLVVAILDFIRQAILLPLAGLAAKTRGYDLLKAVLGQDPVTGEKVVPTPEVLIGGFMKLIGQEEVWENAKKAKAIPRIWVWFQGALAGLKGFVGQIPTLFINTLKSLEIIDLVIPPKAFIKVAGAFGSFALQFITWAGNAVWTLLEIVFDVLSPGAFGYIKKTGAALKSILKNPLPFVLNLVKAAKLGFQKFADNIGGHLKAGLIDWLTGSLEGVYIPKALSLPELGKFALSVLGISWAQIRAKIVKALGPSGEIIMKGLETTFDIVVALVTGGPAAAWELIKEKLSDLKDQVVSGIIGFVTDAIVKKAIPKLIAMFIPGAGFISAIISIYDTIKTFIEQLTKIIQVVKAFVDSIVAIAAGNIAAAANRVEGILSKLLSLAISFLAGFLGLGKITDKIKEIIGKVRATVDKAIDSVIAWIVNKAKSLFAKLFGKKDQPDERTEKQKQEDLEKGLTEADSLLQDKETPLKDLKKKLVNIKAKYKMTALDFQVVSKDLEEGNESVQAVGEINPKGNKPAKPHNLKELVASIHPIHYRYRGTFVKIVSGPLKGKSVKFDALGFPNFAPYAKVTVKIKMHGNRLYRVPDGDFGNANEKAHFKRNKGEPEDHTWHHHQDRQTMQLIPTEIHDAFRHSGGVWVIGELGEKG